MLVSHQFLVLINLGNNNSVDVGDSMHCPLSLDSDLQSNFNVDVTTHNYSSDTSPTHSIFSLVDNYNIISQHIHQLAPPTAQPPATLLQPPSTTALATLVSPQQQSAPTVIQQQNVICAVLNQHNQRSIGKSASLIWV